MVFNAVPRHAIIDALVHIRNLHRRMKPRTGAETLAYERREAITRDLLSNLPRNHEHPTLKTLLEIADICSLTLEGAHRLFGYNLDAVRDFDLKLNSKRTHIFESYPFNRGFFVDLPTRLASQESFDGDALLRDLVLEWQRDTPIRVIDEEGWKKEGVFYVHVGTEDSLGSSVPPGSLALVEPISDAEKARPSSKAIYLLQFPNGYRCNHCIVAGGKLRPFNTTRQYLGREEYAYPGAVRIAGRIRMFAASLPIPDQPLLRSLPRTERGADLILPWEHTSRDRLLATKQRRFKRSREEREFIRETLKDALKSEISARTERRYRSTTSSDPHVNALLHLTIANVARYTDALRTGGSWFSDQGRFSLDSLLKAKTLEDALAEDRNARVPTPIDVWEARRHEFGEWPPLLSMKFPQLQLWDDRVVRLANGGGMMDLDPVIGPGTWLLLDKVLSIPDTRNDQRRAGWSRPIYILRRGLEMICGYMERDANEFVLLADNSGAVKEKFRADSLVHLSRVSGIAVPV